MSETSIYNWLTQTFVWFVASDPVPEPRPSAPDESRLFAPDVERAIAALPRPCYISLATRRQMAAELDAAAARG